MRKLLLTSSALIGAAMLTAPAFASTDAQVEISELKAEVQQQTAVIQKLAAKVDELETQEASQDNKVVQLQNQETGQDNKVDQLQQQEAAQTKESSRVEPTAAAADTHDWSGPYVGANVGAGMTSGSVIAEDDALDDIFSDVIAQGGLHAGYNYQMKNTVLGVEAEANLGSQDHKGQMDSQLTRSQMDWSSALLGRAGIAVGNTLFLVDAGPAIAHLNGTSQENFGSHTKWAVDTWTPGIKGGIGAEFMVTPDISLRAQYSVLAVAEQTTSVSIESEAWSNMQQTATVGADWHF
jgi:opacity protein-like surface antigen